ncbi:MAG: PDZ domain-containing protein [Candidatus Omnitrophica bacterium]|nr:PDZ domain-containing protein [Candidatus Omnitrophota bacterium]MBU4589768.1 PDZ domain-containing protein [Candidatus Omnitrophota bacterium]
MRYIVIVAVFIFIVTASLFADTIIMKNGEKAKGLVVDEYVDRITLSTIDGENDILREDIDRIEYDTPEQNFMQLGRQYDAKGWYDKAAFYYKKAMELNPSYKEAREGYLASHAKMWRHEERRTKKELERQSMVMDWWRNRNKETSPTPKDKELALKNTIGLSLVGEQGLFAIGEVVANSSADKAGIKKRDLLVGIWGKLIRYWSTEEILEELLGPKYSEVRVLIEKEIRVPVDKSSKDLYKDLGISLVFEYEGLVIKDVASGQKGDSLGLKKGDFVIAVDKNMTRYLPLDSIIALINSAGNNEGIVFTVRRNINLRRE